MVSAERQRPPKEPQRVYFGVPFQIKPELTSEGFNTEEPAGLIVNGFGKGQIDISPLDSPEFYMEGEGAACRLADGEFAIRYVEGKNGALRPDPATFPLRLSVTIDTERLLPTERLECSIRYKSKVLRGVDTEALDNLQNKQTSDYAHFATWMDTKDRHKPAEYYFSQRPDLFDDIWFVIEKKTIQDLP